MNPEEICRNYKGRIDANFCTIRLDGQEITVSMWNPLTIDKPELHFNEEDFKNVISLAKKQPRHNLHFFSKSIKNGNVVYGVQAYEGNFKDGEYYGWTFYVDKRGRIIKQTF